MTKRNLLLDEIVKVSLLLSSFVVLFPSTNATTNERDLYASTTSLFTQEMEQEEASDFFGLQVRRLWERGKQKKVDVSDILSIGFFFVFVVFLHP